MAEKTILYTTKDLQEIFKCGRKKLYEIIHLKDFPALRIGNIIYVEKNDLERWLRHNRA